MYKITKISHHKHARKLVKFMGGESMFGRHKKTNTDSAKTTKNCSNRTSRDCGSKNEPKNCSSSTKSESKMSSRSK